MTSSRQHREASWRWWSPETPSDSSRSHTADQLQSRFLEAPTRLLSTAWDSPGTEHCQGNAAQGPLRAPRSKRAGLRRAMSGHQDTGISLYLKHIRLQSPKGLSFPGNPKQPLLQINCAERPRADPRGPALGFAGPLGSRGMGSPAGRLTAEGWKLPAPRDAPGGGRPSSWAGACGAAEEGGGRFTRRPADWLRVATSGGVCSILSECAAGLTSPARRSVCGSGRAARRLLAPCIPFAAPGSAAGQRRP